MKVPCNNTAKVIRYVDQMNKSGVFKEKELLKWDNNATLQTRVATKTHFATISIDWEAFKRRLADNRPFNSALALGTPARGGHMRNYRVGVRRTTGRLTPSLRSVQEAKMGAATNPESSTLLTKRVTFPKYGSCRNLGG